MIKRDYRIVRGKLVAIEGIDGSGKTALVEYLWATLAGGEGEHKWTAVKEPTDGPGSFGKLLRSHFADHSKLDSSEWLRLYVLDRLTQVQTHTEHRLRNVVNVLSDRCYISTAVYQQIFHGFDPEMILQFHRATCPVPDLVLLLDLPAEEALVRVARRWKPTSTDDQFERLDRLQAARSLYLKTPRDLLVGDGVERIKVIDASLPSGEVYLACLREILALF